MQLKPLQDRVLVKRTAGETQTPGGIVIPGNTSEKENRQGEVIAVGPGRLNEDGKLIPVTSVRSGDRVMYPAHAGYVEKIGGEEFVLLQERELLARVH